MEEIEKGWRGRITTYFHLGRLVDMLHDMGLSYRQAEKDLRDNAPDARMPRHTTLFNAHKFYLTVKEKFGSDIDRFLAENPEITWKELYHRLLPESSSKCSTVKQQKAYMREHGVKSLPPSKSLSQTYGHNLQETAKHQERTDWLPKKPALIRGRPIHEVLRDRSVWEVIPSEDLLKMLSCELVFSKKVVHT